MNIAQTGKSQASALDIHSKIEGQFLERYSRYIIQDEYGHLLTDSYMHLLHQQDPKKFTQSQLIQYQTNQINNASQEANVFFALKAFTFSHFSSLYNKVLDQFYSQDNNRSLRSIQQSQPQFKKQLFMKYQPQSFKDDAEQQHFYLLHSNQYAQKHDTIQQGELVLVHSLVKASPQRTKQLAYDIKRRIHFLFQATVWRVQQQVIESEYLPYMSHYKHQFITIVVLYNGDVNHNFQRSLQLNSVQIANVSYHIKLKVYFVSKLALFYHFKESNSNSKIEYISDRIITFYDMNRTRASRNKLLKQLDHLKRQFSEVLDNDENNSSPYFTFALVGIVVLLGGYFLYTKKLPNLRMIK